MTAPINRQPHIQGLRAIAVIVVIAFHAGLPLPGGFVGVDIFFVISGYVITAMLLRELARNGRIDFARFYVRRFKRLTPALAVTAGTTVLLGAFILSPLGPQQQAARTAIGAMLLAANVIIAQSTGGYFDAPAATNPLLNIWSLSVEEQFYLAFPLLMVIGWSLARSGRAARALVTMVTVMSFALAVYGSRNGTSANILDGFYSPFTRAWEFGIGALLAQARQPRWTPRGARTLSLLGAIGILASLMFINGGTAFPSAWTLLPALSTLVLISAAAVGSHLMQRLLTTRLMTRIGDWSYSLYLWHWPTIVFATVLFPEYPSIALVAAVCSVVPALLSYRFVEQPIRNREFPARALAIVVVATVLTPIAAASASLLVAEKVWKPRVHNAAASAMHAGYVQGCHYEPGDAGRDPKPCVWQPDATARPVYLLGDSNAAQFVEALMDATRAQQRRLTVTTTSGCPLLDIRMDGPDFPGYGGDCLARNDRLLRWMTTQPAGTVFLAASDDYWLGTGWRVTLQDGTSTDDHRRMIKAMRSSLARVVRTLTDAGHHVVLVQTIPHWVAPHAWEPARCSLSSSLDGCVQRMPLSFAIARSAAVRSALAQVARSERASLIDVTPQVCPNAVCVTATKQLPVYRDATHITVAMSHRLAPEFANALAATAR